MPTIRNFILVALFAVILGTLIDKSGENVSAQAECLRVCGLVQEERSKTEVQASRSLSCDECLERMKDRHTLTEKIFIQRKRRSLLDPSNCVHWSDEESIPGQTIPSVVNVTFGQYKNTSYWYANISWTPLNDSYGYLNGIVLRLSIADLPITCIVLPKNQTFFSLNLSFYGYNYREPIYLQVLGIPYSNKVIPIKGYLPAIPGSPSPTTLTEATGIPASLNWSKLSSTEAGSPSPTTLTEATGIPASLSITKLSTTEGSNNTKTYVSIAAGTVAGILVGILALCLLKYIRRRKRSLPVPSGFDYHAFIIYSTGDTKWVKRLLHFLEDGLHLKCCIHYRDFEVGGIFYDSMVNSIEKSYKIIAVYSENFLNSDSCIYELNRAKFRLLKKNDNSLVIIRIDGADCKELPPELRERSFIDYHTVLEWPLWRRKLRKFLEVSGDSSDQSATMDNNNSNNCRTTVLIENGQNRVRNQFNRLNSTSSSDTVEIFV